MNLSDIIEDFILKTIGEDSSLNLSRNELANFFNVSPSQINYVLSTRFTFDRGFETESKRGGGGYIVLKKLNLDDDYLSNLIKSGTLPYEEVLSRSFFHQKNRKNEKPPRKTRYSFPFGWACQIGIQTVASRFWRRCKRIRHTCHCRQKRETPAGNDLRFASQNANRVSIPISQAQEGFLVYHDIHRNNFAVLYPHHHIPLAVFTLYGFKILVDFLELLFRDGHFETWHIETQARLFELNPLIPLENGSFITVGFRGGIHAVLGRFCGIRFHYGKAL